MAFESLGEPDSTPVPSESGRIVACDSTAVSVVKDSDRYDVLRTALLDKFSAPQVVAELCHLIQTGIRDTDLQIRYKYITLLFDRIWGKPVQPTAIQTTSFSPPTISSSSSSVPGIRIEFVNAPSDVKDVHVKGGRTRGSDRKLFAREALADSTAGEK